MNYLREINAFMDWLETNPLDAITQALWFHLMAINNKCNWLEWFTVANLTLQAKLGVDKKTIIKHRNILVQKGLIDYKTQGSKKAGKYKMISISGQLGENIPPIQEPKENISGKNPPKRELEEDIRGNIPLNLPPNRPPIREPNRPPLVKLNKTKLNEKHTLILSHWNSKGIIKHRQLTEKMRGHINARLSDYSVNEIIEAIDNYDTVLKGDEYFFSYRWKLDEFLLRGLEKFLTESKPLINYLKNKQGVGNGQAQAQASAPTSEQFSEKQKLIKSLYLS